MYALRIAIMTMAVMCLTGFAKLNTLPPFIDPANPVPHATVAVLPPEGGVKPLLLGADGYYANYNFTLLANRRSSGEPVDEMHVLPGTHRVRLKCWKQGTTLNTTVELTARLEADRRYQVGCRPGRQIKTRFRTIDYAEFIFLDDTGRPVPFTVREIRQ